MKQRFSWMLAVLLAAGGFVRGEDLEVKLIQGFEGQAQFDVWPPESAKAEARTDWVTEGKQSLLLKRGTMIAVSEMATHDWSAYQVWRFHVRVPGTEGVALGVELADKEPGNLNRMQGTASAPPGDSVVDVDIAGDLWRGEINKPYRLVKTPLDKKAIARFAITAQSGDIYVDQVELVKVKQIAAEGAYALSLGGSSKILQSQWIGIKDSTAWDEAKGYGISSGAGFLDKTTPYPTPVMGGGLIMNNASLQVKLKEGKYIGWAIFERSGFWENYQGLFTKLTVKANNQAVYSREGKQEDPFFMLQDREVMDQQGVLAMVMDRQMTGDFAFTALSGRNAFTLDVEGSGEYPPRLAGLVLAPDTAEGRAFIAAHKKLQEDTILATHRLIDRRVRQGDPAQATEPLLVIPLPSDAKMHPGDWPAATVSQPVPPMQSMAGLTACRVLGLYAKENFAGLKPVLSDLKSDGAAIPAASVRLLVNQYMPVHGYDQTACWVETHDYRSRDLDVRPDLARALLVMIDVPADAKPGTYTGTLELMRQGNSVKSVPVSLKVSAGTVPLADMAIGLFFSGVTIPKSVLGEQAYWQLSESLLQQLHRGSFTMVTGGPSFQIKWEGKTPVISGDDAVKFLAMAKQYDLARIMTNYGGLYLWEGRGAPTVSGMSQADALSAIHKAWEAFRVKNGLPDYLVYSYDEPGTDSEFAPLEVSLTALRAAGFKTIGYTSMGSPEGADAHHKMLAKETTNPAYGGHSAATLKYVHDLGNDPWVYNNGLDRNGIGTHLWRNHRYGASGRIDWIGSIIQGFQYDALDSREPDLSCFYFHKTQGVLVSPLFLGAIEGGVDARLLFELEKRAKAKPDHPASTKILALFKTIEDRPYNRARMEWSALEDLRGQMLSLIEESSK